MVIGTVLVPVLFILGVVSNAWMPSWGAASVAIVFGLSACFLLVRKIGSGGRRASAVIFALGSGLGVVSAVGQADRAPSEKLDEPTTAAGWVPIEKPVEAAPVATEPVEEAPEPEPVDEKPRAMGARLACSSEVQDHYPGVDWKFFHNISAKPAGDGMEVTIEGQRESQAYRVVCQVHDGDAATTHTLYRVDAKSKKMSVETKALEPCTTVWTAASVCRPARPGFAPVVPPGKRLDEAADQCRVIARSKYAGIEWRTIMGISSDWFELGGVHGARTSIQGTRNGQSFNISCFLPDGASTSVHELSTL